MFQDELRLRQRLACQLLETAVHRGALAGAYLLAGRHYPDKWLLVKQLTASLNCLSRNPDQYYCCLTTGTELCQSCQWIGNDQHPQAFITLSGQGDSKKIPVEKSRQLAYELSKTSIYTRVICIPHAEQNIFHPEAANALLKVIEEPGSRCHFFLFAPSSENVLSTIVSRCQEIPVNASSSQPRLTHTSDEQTEQAEELRQRLNSLRQELRQQLHNQFFTGASQHQPFLQSIGDSQKLCKQLLELFDEGIEAKELLDTVVTSDHELLGPVSAQHPAVSLYLFQLLGLSETAKKQLDHYVREHNVLESFSYSLSALRTKYLGDYRLAKDLPAT